MPTIAIVCGASVTASAMIAEKVRARVASSGRRPRVIESSVMDLLSPSFRADLVVTTVDLPDALGIPRVSGMPLLLGTNPEATYEAIERELTELEGGAA